MNKVAKFFIIVLIFALLICGAIIGYKIYKDQNNNIIANTDANVEENENTIEVEIKTVQTFKGNDRPIAVMIDNHKAALPQGGLNNAYIVYEIIVEGGESRLMALFKGQDLDKIGPVRSARHYFLDYALENDAIYTHFGWSPQAQSDISSLYVNNINGIFESEKSFWRVKDKSAPHNVATSTEDILEIAERKGYETTSSTKSVLNYVTDEVTLDNGQNADTVTIPYSYSNVVKYTYDKETQRYQRYSRDIEETDWITDEKVTTKNIIITFARNATLNDGENKGRQTLYNVGTLDGYYITNGKAIKITCEKSSRSAQTVYKDLDGNEIKVNDGNTYIQICPIDAKVVIEGEEEPEAETNTETNIIA